MDFSKYSRIPTEPATAKEIGLAAASLSAMARRGLIEVISGKPNKYRRINSIAAKIYCLCALHEKEYETYFTLYNSPHELGMFCSIINDTVCDCWGKPYDFSKAQIIDFRGKKYNINTGRIYE